MKSSHGALRIAAERQRQIDVHGYTPEHDAEHGGGELMLAAHCYLDAALLASTTAPGNWSLPIEWPWAPHHWKPSDDPIRNLEKAGALVAAEIDRILAERMEVADRGSG